MIGIIAAAAGVAAVPIAGGVAYRKSRQRKVAEALVINTPNGIVEERFVRVGGVDQWIQIRGEDRDNPVLLVLHPGGRRTLALLLALEADGARLHLGTRTITVPYATLDQAWLGQYLVVWREPAFLPETVRRGEAGAAVDWVQAQLARFDTLRPAASGPYLYDETMEARVRQVQAGLGLVPDGIVGPETALALASRDPGGPRLGRQPD